MLDLVTEKDIDHIDGPLAAKLEIWAATLHVGVWAVPVTLFLTEWSLAGAEFWRGFFLALTTGVLFGLIAGLLGHWAGQHRAADSSRKRIRSILANQSPAVPPGPAEATARALCAVLVSDGQSAGGFLYVCPDSLVFQPHQPQPRWPWQNQPQGFSPVVLAPPNSLTLDRLWLQPKPWWKQPFFRQPRAVLRCASADSGIILVTPPAHFLEPIIQSQIDELRRRSAV